MALSTVSDVKSVIGVDMSSADETAVTNIFIQAADAAIKNYLDMNWNTQQVLLIHLMEIIKKNFYICCTYYFSNFCCRRCSYTY